ARQHPRFGFTKVERAFPGHADLLAEQKIKKGEQKQDRPEAQQRLTERVRLGANGRLNSRGGEFVLQIVSEIEINNGAKLHVRVLGSAGALLDVFAAQFLCRFAFFDVQSERRILVVHDLLVLEQLEEAIVGNIVDGRIVAAPEQHRQGEKA